VKQLKLLKRLLWYRLWLW